MPKLIVNYLTQSMTDNEFRNLFEGIGALEICQILRDSATDYSDDYFFPQQRFHLLRYTLSKL